MRPPLRTSRPGLALLSGVLLAIFAVSGCGSAHSGASSGTSTTPAAAPTPTTSTASATPTATAPSTAPATSVPAGGPVPTGFTATSVTFVSTQEAFVLGTAPCSNAPCTSIVRTLDRGASWVGLPAPVVPLGQASTSTGAAVWGIRFANPQVGFVFGNGLWETTDGGQRWTAVASPQGSILDLEVIDSQVLALTASGGSAQAGTLWRQPLSGGAWQAVTQVSGPHTIATQGQVAAVLDGSSVIVTGNGGLSIATHALPCTTPAVGTPTAAAVTSPDGLALLCAGGAAMGSVEKTVYVSSDLGATWAKAGTAPLGGDPIGISAANPDQLVVAAASGASELYYSGNGGASWTTAYYVGDGGAGFNDLGFTTTSDGVVVHGPAISDPNSEGRPGQLLLTSDGGAAWQVVSF